MADQFYFGNETQDLLLACMCRAPAKFATVGPLLKPEYMWGLAAVRCLAFMQDYHAEKQHYPTLKFLDAYILERCGRERQALYDDCHDYIVKLRKENTRDADAMAELVVRFCRERATIVAIKQAAEMVRKKEIPDGGFAQMFDEVVSIGKDIADLGLCYWDDAEQVIKSLTEKTWGVRTGYTLLDSQWINGWGPGWLVVPLAPPKSYKCFGKGTGILMFDGSVKQVEEIKVGDLVMGDDSTPRRVLTAGSGNGPLYRVEQDSGDDFVCNDAHVMCVKNLRGEVKEITAEEYSGKVPWFQRTWKGFKAAVEFPQRDVPLDPYFLGLWLGDGSTNHTEITVADKDPEIADWLTCYASALGMRITPQPANGSACFRFVPSEKRDPICSVPGCGQPHRTGGLCLKHYNHAKYHDGFKVHPAGQTHAQSTIKSALKSLGILHNKRIPDLYRFNDRKTRLSLLAGLIDSDGSLVKKGRMAFVNANQRLAEDVCWLARSLGFLVNVAPYKSSIRSTGFEGLAWHVTFSGNLAEIPTIVKRKRGRNAIRKKGARHKIEVNPIGTGEYYGFTVDGNSRFLLADFTVTHNSTFCVNLALNMTRRHTNTKPVPVFYYACEISAELTCARGYCRQAGMSMTDMHQSTNKFTATVLKKLNEDFSDPEGAAGQLLVKTFPSKTAGITDIRSHALHAIETFGVRPRAIFIDHAETVKPNKRVKDASDHRQQADIYTEARALGAELNCCVVMPDRCNKETVQHPVPSMTSFQGAFQKAGEVDVGIGLCQTPEERTQGLLRYFIFLNRHGPQYGYFQGKVMDDKFTLQVDEELKYHEEVAKWEEAMKRTKGDRNTKGGINWAKMDEK